MPQGSAVDRATACPALGSARRHTPAALRPATRSWPGPQLAQPAAGSTHRLYQYTRSPIVRGGRSLCRDQSQRSPRAAASNSAAASCRQRAVERSLRSESTGLCSTGPAAASTPRPPTHRRQPLPTWGVQPCRDGTEFLTRLMSLRRSFTSFSSQFRCSSFTIRSISSKHKSYGGGSTWFWAAGRPGHRLGHMRAPRVPWPQRTAGTHRVVQREGLVAAHARQRLDAVAQQPVAEAAGAGGGRGGAPGQHRGSRAQAAGSAHPPATKYEFACGW